MKVKLESGEVKDIKGDDLNFKHYVMCGDATDKNQVEQLMQGQKATISFQSPPYNAGDNSLGGNKNLKKSKYKNNSDNLPQSDYLHMLRKFTQNSMKNSELTFTNVQQLAGNKIAVVDYLNEFKEHLVDIAIWNKGDGQPAMQESVMNSRFEYVFIFDKNKNPPRKIRTNFFKNKKNIFELNPSGKNQNKEIIGAVFPIEFPRNFIEMACPRNEIVLDLFAGSGTTLIASEQTGRRSFNMEIDPIYTSVILERYESYTNKKPHKIK